MTQAYRIYRQLRSSGANLYDGNVLLGTFSSSAIARGAAFLLSDPYWINQFEKPLPAADVALLYGLSRFQDAGFFRDQGGEVRSIHRPFWGFDFRVDPVARRVEVVERGNEIFSTDLYDSADQLHACSSWAPFQQSTNTHNSRSISE